MRQVTRFRFAFLTPAQQDRLRAKAVRLARAYDRLIVLALRYGYIDLADTLIRRKERLLARYGLPAYITE